MTGDDGWTPYGLEAFRQRHLKRRRRTVLVLVLVVAVAYVGLLQFGIDSQTTTTIDTFGGGDGDSLTIDRPQEERRTPDATLTISPGELNTPPSAIQASDDGASGPPAPGGDRPTVEPIYWPGLLVRWGIPLGLLLVGYLVGRGRGKSEEVNYGVYKGAMPMEKISARYSHLVETTRATYQDPFGKRRPHYVPDADGRTAVDGTDDATDANDDS